MAFAVDDAPMSRITFDFGIMPAPATVTMSNIKLEIISVDYTSNELPAKSETFSYFDVNQNNLIIKNDSGRSKTTVFALSGATIALCPLADGVNQFDASGWAPGIYIVVVENGQKRYAQKILKR